ncbi:uncharacterized protein F5147DRAFT_647090 [Suillus discolor]|uniref:Uncharacterized protein n=1 Tax=Suillus discolor TaxID=1912936 RepID=A0A9P7FJI2_9AGAM|nr:uncharacterized protein F5147DRAFT_647090 [Suillus discolor]KAG2120630.1 hypothetical protein F5147DRAFT_647090 [Suillus discolor]
MYNRDWIYNPSKVEKENSGDGQRVSGKLEQMFDRLFADSQGRAHMLEWFHPHTVAYISLTVSNEMDAVKEALCGTLNSVMLQFLSTWDLSTTIQDKVALKALILQHILRCAAQMECAIERTGSRTAVLYDTLHPLYYSIF